MTNKVKFRTITLGDFQKRHSEADGELTPDVALVSFATQYGEVKIPGYGWYPCVLDDKGVPSIFYDEDDGWNPVPNGVEFVKV